MSRLIRAVVRAAGLVVLLPFVAIRAQNATPQVGRVEGVVWDSTRAAPLGGSMVQLVRPDGQSAPRAVAADSAGRFVVDSLLAGTWVVGVLHKRLDSLALDELVQRVDVRGRGTTRVTVAVPSVAGLSSQLCRAAPEDSTGYLVGRLRSAEGDRAGIVGTVRVEWSELTVVGARLERRIVAAETRSAESGNYLLCGIPANSVARARAWSGTDSTGAIDLEFLASPVGRLDFHVGRTAYVRELLDSAAVDDTTAVIVLRRGSGRVRGTVVGALGNPIENATVSVVGSGLTQRTDGNGRFDLRGAATGTQLLDVRAVGLEVLRIPVDLFAGDTTSRRLTMSPVRKLATVEVRANRARLMGQDMIDFEARRNRGVGRFFGPEDLIALDPVRIGSLVQRVPGVKVVQDGMFGDRILMRGSGFSMYCAPDIWLDGFRVVNDGTMDSFIQPQLIRAVEVYTSATSLPPQYVSGNLCGAIVLWSGPRTLPGAQKR